MQAGRELEEMPDVCKECPENYYCSLEPDLWNCKEGKDQDASRT